MSERIFTCWSCQITVSSHNPNVVLVTACPKCGSEMREEGPMNY